MLQFLNSQNHVSILSASKTLRLKPSKVVIPKLTMKPKQITAIKFFPSYSVQGFSYDQ